jgi:hypothetical protein
MASVKRESWVRIYGLPLHVWGENAFRLLIKPWGDYVGVDEETRQRARFDVARVKILTSATESIDTVSNIKVLDDLFAVRMIEEGGGPLEFVHFTKEEDQIGWSAAGSSCGSAVRGPAAAMVEGVVSDEFDSDGSEHEQLENTGSVQVVHGNGVEVSSLKSNPKETFINTEFDSPIHGKDTKNKTKREDSIVQVEGEEAAVIRGLSTSQCDDQGVLAGVGSVSVEPSERGVVKTIGLNTSSPFIGPLSSPIFSLGGSGKGGLVTNRKVGQNPDVRVGIGYCP